CLDSWRLKKQRLPFNGSENRKLHGRRSSNRPPQSCGEVIRIGEVGGDRELGTFISYGNRRCSKLDRRRSIAASIGRHQEIMGIALEDVRRLRLFCFDPKSRYTTSSSTKAGWGCSPASALVIERRQLCQPLDLGIVVMSYHGYAGIFVAVGCVVRRTQS